MHHDVVKRVSERRLAILRRLLETEDLCGIILFEDDPIGCKLAVTEHFSVVIVTYDSVHVLADPTLYHAAFEESPWDVVQIKDFSPKGVMNALLSIFRGCKLGSRIVVGINKSWGRTRLKFLYVDVLEVLRSNGVGVVDATRVLSQVFDKPFEEELIIIKWLSDTASKALQAIEEALKPGMREYEVAAIADKILDENGVTGRWFQTIVVSGPRAATPHARTSERRIGPGDPVVVDLGPLWMGYDGCVAHTFIVGRDRGYWHEILRDVLNAIQAGLEHVKPGTPIKVLDEAPRKLLKSRGYPDYPHLTGHPIGGFYKPVIAGFINYRLEPNMVFAYEPGVYLPGKGGVRIEPHILVNNTGYEILTKYHEKVIRKH